VVAYAGVMGQQKTDAALLHVATHHHLVGALEHLYDLPLGPTTPINTRHCHQNFIAVEDLVHLPGREKQVLVTLERSRKTIPVAMSHHPTAKQVHALGHAVSAASSGDDLPIALHRSQPFAQRLEITIAIQCQLRGDNVEPQRCISPL